MTHKFALILLIATLSSAHAYSAQEWTCLGSSVPGEYNYGTELDLEILEGAERADGDIAVLGSLITHGTEDLLAHFGQEVNRISRTGATYHGSPTERGIHEYHFTLTNLKHAKGQPRRKLLGIYKLINGDGNVEGLVTNLICTKNPIPPLRPASTAHLKQLQCGDLHVEFTFDAKGDQEGDIVVQGPIVKDGKRIADINEYGHLVSREHGTQSFRGSRNEKRDRERIYHFELRESNYILAPTTWALWIYKSINKQGELDGLVSQEECTR